MTADDPTPQQLVSNAAIRAGETARLVSLAALQVRPVPQLTVEQQAELRRQADLAASALHTLGVHLLRAWLPIVEAAITAVAQFHRELVEAGLVDDVEPADPAARALHRRRHRNTGPQQRQRAPRRIDPRGCK
jgi:hypothetical protein